MTGEPFLIGDNMNKTVKFMCEVAISVAVGIVLDYISNLYSQFIFAAGGSIGLAMIAIFLMSYRWGLKGGLVTGLLIGVVQTLYGAYFVHPIQIFLDYYGAYTVVGFSGLFANKIKQAVSLKQKSWLIVGSIFVGVILRFLCAYCSGVIFFADWADPRLGPVLYSIVYNASYLIPSGILCSLMMVLIVYKAPNLLTSSYETKKIGREQLFAIASGAMAIMALVLFTGEFLVNDSPFYANYYGYNAAFGTTASITSDSEMLKIKLNVPCLIAFILYSLSFFTAFIKEKYKIIKYSILSILSLISAVMLSIVPLTLTAELKNITDVAVKINYPFYLLLGVSYAIFIVNVVFAVLLTIKKDNPVVTEAIPIKEEATI